MQINKKLFTSAIIALLILSVVAVALPANAITTAPGTFVPVSVGIPTVPLTSGPVGTRVSVVGSTTAGTAALYSTVTAYWGSLSGAVLGTASASSTGTYVITVTIPSAIIGTHDIVVNDGIGAFGAPFAVTSTLVASTTPATSDTTYNAKVLPGDSLTLTGHGFGATKAVTVTFTGAAGTITLTVPTITTNSTGSFIAVVTTPAIIVANYGAYTVTATDASANTASATILIDYYVTVTPATGPSGITAIITGRVPASTSVTVTFGSATAFTTTSSATGSFTGTYALTGPVVVGTSYTVTATYGVGLTTATTFQVTASPIISAISVSNGVVGTVVLISGTGFSGSASITLTIGTTVVNSTALDSRFGPTTAGGAFTNKQFTVPAIAAGTYYITVTDQYGATTGTANQFTVNPTPATTMTIGASSYAQGDTISFAINTNEANLGTISPMIIAPSAQIWFSAAAWTLTTGINKFVQYQSQVDINNNHFTLPTDAPTGTWNWTITCQPASLGGAVIVTYTGLFTVTAKTTLDTVNAKLDAINGTVVTIQTNTGTIITNLSALDAKVVSIDGKFATLSTSMGTVTASVSSLSASISSISSGVATIQTSFGTVNTQLSSLDAVLGVVAGDTATISTSLGPITTQLSAINPILTSIQGDVATIKTDVGTLQGKVTEVKDGVATIQTGVGTLQTNVGNLQTDVNSTKDNSSSLSPLLYVAIVLALIAAIAAVFCVIIVRQKIAS